MSVVNLEEAAAILNRGDIVAIPTETVYGLAGRIDQPKAMTAIFETKKRPSFDPLIVHISDKSQVKAISDEWSEVHEILADAFWPGPFTLILKKQTHVSDVITSGLETVGVRCPNHPLTLELLASLSAPVAAPSANLFSKTSPTCAEHVSNEFQGLVPVIDGGACEVGLESSICQVLKVDFKSKYCRVQLLRRGSILPTDISQVLQRQGWRTEVVVQSSTIAPGQLKIHYRPTIPLVLVKNHEMSDKQVIAQVSERFDTEHVAWLKLPDNPQLAARELYSSLRQHGKAPATVLVCRWSKNWNSEYWKTIEDRLNRASTLIMQPESIPPS